MCVCCCRNGKKCFPRFYWTNKQKCGVKKWEVDRCAPFSVTSHRRTIIGQRHTEFGWFDVVNVKMPYFGTSTIVCARFNDEPYVWMTLLLCWVCAIVLENQQQVKLVRCNICLNIEFRPLKIAMHFVGHLIWSEFCMVHLSYRVGSWTLVNARRRQGLIEVLSIFRKFCMAWVLCCKFHGPNLALQTEIWVNIFV